MVSIVQIGVLSPVCKQTLKALESGTAVLRSADAWISGGSRGRAISNLPLINASGVISLSSHSDTQAHTTTNEHTRTRSPAIVCGTKLRVQTMSRRKVRSGGGATNRSNDMSNEMPGRGVEVLEIPRSRSLGTRPIPEEEELARPKYTPDRKLGESFEESITHDSWRGFPRKSRTRGSTGRLVGMMAYTLTEPPSIAPL